jgi:hypothetical protein
VVFPDRREFSGALLLFVIHAIFEGVLMRARIGSPRPFVESSRLNSRNASFISGRGSNVFIKDALTEGLAESTNLLAEEAHSDLIPRAVVALRTRLS